MSAVASAEAIPAGVAGLVPEPHAGGLSIHQIQAAEQKRWMTWFGVPALFAAIFMGAVLATGQEVYLGLSIASIVADIFVLVWLAMSSDTNGLIGDAPPH